MARPVSPAYLLLWHTPFKELTKDDQVRFIESIARADLDPMEYVEGKSALDRFLEAIPRRDTVFAHDMIRLLHWKGVRSVIPPAQLSDPSSFITASLLRELESEAPDPARLRSYRLAAGLLETVYRKRTSSSNLKVLKEVLSSCPDIEEIEGLLPEVWLATRGFPENWFELREIRGWVSEVSGSESERYKMHGPVVRGLSRMLDKREKVSPVQRMAMDITLLVWSGATNTKVDAGIFKRWGGKSQSELLDLVSHASSLMQTPDQGAIGRTGAQLLMASRRLAAAGREAGSDESPVVSSLGSCLLLQGLKVRRGENAPLLEREFLIDLIEKTQYEGSGIIRSLAKLPDGPQEALSLALLFSDGWLADSQKIALNSWVNGTIRVLSSQEDRFVRVMGSMGEPLERALRKNPHLWDNILPKIAAARESQLSRQLPEASMVPQVRRQRF